MKNTFVMRQLPPMRKCSNMLGLDICRSITFLVGLRLKRTGLRGAATTTGWTANIDQNHEWKNHLRKLFSTEDSRPVEISKMSRVERSLDGQNFIAPAYLMCYGRNLAFYFNCYDKCFDFRPFLKGSFVPFLRSNEVNGSKFEILSLKKNLTQKILLSTLDKYKLALCIKQLEIPYE